MIVEAANLFITEQKRPYSLAALQQASEYMLLHHRAAPPTPSTLPGKMGAPRHALRDDESVCIPQSC